MSVEDLRRATTSTQQTAQTTAKDVANKAATAGKIIAIDAVLATMPPPVNAAAKALGDGLYAALKTSADAVKQPANSLEDPIKLMAYAIAFAILKAIWCFIKSLLHPLPIIGLFFPLCSDDPQISGINLSNDARAAKQEADQDPENRALNAANNRNASALQNIALTEAQNEAIANANRNVTNISIPNAGGPMDSGATGMTFAEFVEKTAPRTAQTTEGIGQGPREALQGQLAQTTNAPVQNVAAPDQPEWHSTEDNAVSSYESYRRLFGL